ncbi:THO complex subunit 5 [Rhizophlyctis rosea]|nr:THO complex subunit 5 [Rhizophlyctis rosea]
MSSNIANKRKREDDGIQNCSNKKLPHLIRLSNVCDEIRAVTSHIKFPRDASQDVSSIAREVSILFAELEQLNRTTVTHTRDAKLVTAEAKQEMDRLNLSLQNCNYERLYLQREIAKCEDFETIYQDVDLQSEEDFRRTAPPELTSTTDDHQFMLNRLKFEMDERIRMEAEEKELLATKDRLTKANKEKTHDLENLDKELEAFVQASIPLQKRLKLSLTHDRQDAEVAALLPAPLFCLFKITLGGSHSFANTVTAEIIGDRAQAATWLENEQRKSIEVKRTKPISSEKVARTASDVAGATESADADDADGESSKHQSRTTPSAQQSNKALYDKHPLSVVLHVKQADGALLAKITFSYLPNLNIVMVTATELMTRFPHLQQTMLLAGLFPKDNGVQSPNPANADLDGLNFRFDVGLAGGHAYHWAQTLCGLEFPAPAEVFASGQDGVGVPGRPYLMKIVDLIRYRFNDLKAFDAQMGLVSQGKVREALGTKAAGVVVKGKIISSKISSFDPTVGDTYEIVVECAGHLFKVEFTLPVNYPYSAPVFAIKKERTVGTPDQKDVEDQQTLRLPSHLQEIEAQVNDYLDGGRPQSAEQYQLLLLQLAKLTRCLEEYCKAAVLGEEQEEAKEKVGIV